MSDERTERKKEHLFEMNGSGVKTTVTLTRILETLIIGAIVGLMSMFLTTKLVEHDVNRLQIDLQKSSHKLDELSKKITDIDLLKTVFENTQSHMTFRLEVAEDRLKNIAARVRVLEANTFLPKPNARAEE